MIGDLSEYAVFYSTETANIPKKKSVSASADYVILTGLPPYTTYSIQVAGVNKTGEIGPLSSIVTTKTFRGKKIFCISDYHNNEITNFLLTIIKRIRVSL